MSVLDAVSTYGLREDDLKEYLRQQFDGKVQVTPKRGLYAFLIPRLLEPTEREFIDHLRGHETFEARFVLLLRRSLDLRIALDAAASRMTIEELQAALKLSLFEYFRKLEDFAKTAEETAVCDLFFQHSDQISSLLCSGLYEPEARQKKTVPIDDLNEPESSRSVISVDSERYNTVEGTRLRRIQREEALKTYSSIPSQNRKWSSSGREDDIFKLSKTRWGQDIPLLDNVRQFILAKERFRQLTRVLRYWVHSNLLHIAIYYGNIEDTKRLLRANWPVDEQDSYGETPLSIAVAQVNLPATRLLVGYGADAKHWSFQLGGTSPTMIAEELWSGELDSIQMVLLAEIIICLHQALPGLNGVHESDMTTWRFHLILIKWDLLEVISTIVEENSVSNLETSHQQPSQILQHFVCLTGSNARYTCSTCINFVQRQWGEFGSSLLGVVGDALNMLHARIPEEDEKYGIMSDFRGVTIVISDGSLAILPGAAKHGIWEQVVQIACWLAAAIRPPSKLQSLSKSLLDAKIWVPQPSPLGSWEGKRIFNIVPAPLEPLSNLDIGRTSCWVNMFSTGVIVWENMSCSWSWGQGLRVDFDLLVNLSAVGTYYMLEDTRKALEDEPTSGVIMVGFRTALIPIYEAGGVMKWHFEYSEVGTIDLQAVKEKLGRWLKAQKPESLQQATCIVGWHEGAEILLGTKENDAMLGMSDSKEIGKTLHLNSVQVGAQAGGAIGPISLNAQVTTQYVYRSNQQRFQPNTDYDMTLNEIYPQVVFIFDTSTLQAWLVPGISLHLHMCHQYFFQNREIWGATKNHIPYAEASVDGAAAAITALRKGRDVRVFADSDEDSARNGLPPNSTTLLQVFQMIHHNLIQTNETREPSVARVWPLSRRAKLKGAELLDMLGTPNSTTMLREVQTLSAKVGPWISLVEYADIVFVCSNIGQPIRPTPSPRHTTECKCCVLPKGQYYLAAHTWCLEKITRKRPWIVTLDEKGRPELTTSQWKVRGSPWHSCRHNPVTDIWASPERFTQDFTQNWTEGDGQVGGSAVMRTGVLVFGESLK